MTTSRDRHRDDFDATAQRDVRTLDRMLAGPPEHRGGDAFRAPEPESRDDRRPGHDASLGVTDVELVRELEYGVR